MHSKPRWNAVHIYVNAVIIIVLHAFHSDIMFALSPDEYWCLISCSHLPLSPLLTIFHYSDMCVEVLLQEVPILS